MTDNIYHELILELAQNPINKGMPAKYDDKFTAENRVCGDNITFFISYDKAKKFKNVFWDGNGCALSVSSASLLSEFLKGKTKVKAAKINPEQILKLLKLKKLNPSRSKCAFLPLDCFKNSK